ncbi:Nuclear protein localization protein [Hortaea werneckii]|nr:Nuclear protein localization protein [Hortaea werneckii]
MGSRDLAKEAFFVLFNATPKGKRGKWLAGKLFHVIFFGGVEGYGRSSHNATKGLSTYLTQDPEIPDKAEEMEVRDGEDALGLIERDAVRAGFELGLEVPGLLGLADDVAVLDCEGVLDELRLRLVREAVGQGDEEVLDGEAGLGILLHVGAVLVDPAHHGWIGRGFDDVGADHLDGGVRGLMGVGIALGIVTRSRPRVMRESMSRRGVCRLRFLPLGRMVAPGRYDVVLFVVPIHETQPLRTTRISPEVEVAIHDFRVGKLNVVDHSVFLRLQSNGRRLAFGANAFRKRRVTRWTVGVDAEIGLGQGWHLPQSLLGICLTVSHGFLTRPGALLLAGSEWPLVAGASCSKLRNIWVPCVRPSLPNVTPFSASIGRESAPCGFGLMVMEDGTTSLGSFSWTSGRMVEMSVVDSTFRRNWPSRLWNRNIMIGRDGDNLSGGGGGGEGQQVGSVG